MCIYIHDVCIGRIQVSERNCRGYSLATDNSSTLLASDWLTRSDVGYVVHGGHIHGSHNTCIFGLNSECVSLPLRNTKQVVRVGFWNRRNLPMPQAAMPRSVAHGTESSASQPFISWFSSLLTPQARGPQK